MSEYIQHRYIKPNSIEFRQYQVALAEQAKNENCLVVLPTGLGKTAIALQVIAEFLSRGSGGVLFLAPTRVLANQHYEFLRNNLNLDDIALLTGEDTLKKRKKLWANSVICATPEITKNDLERQIVSAEQFSLVIFDEAHRTVGDYAYSWIAQRLAGTKARIMGMTATLPSEKEKATEIITTLRIASVAQRNEQSQDVKPYIQHTTTEWVKVDLPPEMREVQAYLRKALQVQYNELQRCGLKLSAAASLSQLLHARDFVLRQNRRAAKPLFTAIRLHYALNILESHGITSFLRFCERTREKKGVGIKDLFENDTNFLRALAYAKDAQKKGIEHSKITKLADLIKSTPQKSIVFTSYRDSVEIIHDNLLKLGISAGFLIGKAGETGLKQKEQIDTVQKFRDGVYNVLIATRVGEEGLDISEVNHVIFFDNVPSSIRFIQRKGRTGRKSIGKLTVLIAKDTIDEAYYWVGQRKIKAAQNMGERLTRDLQRQQETPKSMLDAYF
ncbi:MAG: DEAD/DEAH box helicase [Candidatus Nitrosotenuis sp.]